ncbi:MAG: hypothetical protein R6U55_02215 [Desulfovermiculus sp.]
MNNEKRQQILGSLGLGLVLGALFYALVTAAGLSLGLSLGWALGWAALITGCLAIGLGGVLVVIARGISAR